MTLSCNQKMNKEKYPILEYDPTRKAIIEPSEHVKAMPVAPHCVMCFFAEVIRRVLEEQAFRIVFKSVWEMGPIHIYEIEYKGRKIAVVQALVGAPSCAALLEETIAVGCSKFIVCGGAGVMSKEITVGKLIIPTAAIREEGTSYHYLPPDRDVEASASAVAAIEATLSEHKIDFIKGKTWTTDAIYRETPEKIGARRAEGALAVEMEAAALFAVAKFRNVMLGQILYGGDDVSGEVWDERGWNSRQEIRENLFWLSVEACLKL